MDVRLLVWGAFGGIGFVFFLGLVVFLRNFHKRGGINNSNNKDGGGGSSRKKFLVAATSKGDDSAFLSSLLRDFTYEQLHNATQGFCTENLLVKQQTQQQQQQQKQHRYYKGLLEGGERIVVKCFGQDDEYDEQGAEAELEILSSISLHRRIASLIGICTTLDERGMLGRLLVFRDMPNGDLESALAAIRQTTPASSSAASSSSSSGSDESLLLVDRVDESSKSSSSSDRSVSRKKPLDWITRFKIAIGVAEALVFLHHECVPAIIHGDLKSGCVLLDQGYEVRLGGLSSSSSSSSNRDEGGTTYHDVYCFGRILMDLISGLDCSSGVDALGEAWLEKAMLHLVPKPNHAKFLAMVDVTLVIDEDHVKELMLLASIASSCLDPRQAQHQSMLNILSVLENPEAATAAAAAA